MSRFELAEQSAKAVLARRAEALKLLTEARALGNRKDVRAWESAVRQYDKLIATYGLERYASRA